MRPLAPRRCDSFRAFACACAEPAPTGRTEKKTLPVELRHGSFCQTRSETALSAVKSTFFGLAQALLGKGRMSARFDCDREKTQIHMENARAFFPALARIR